LSAGDKGYKELTISIPAGYKTIGISSISCGHIGAVGGLSLLTNVPMEMTGTSTIYLAYGTTVALSAVQTDFNIRVLCIPTSSDITVIWFNAETNDPKLSRRGNPPPA
jgi:hypothetical protein